MGTEHKVPRGSWAAGPCWDSITLGPWWVALFGEVLEVQPLNGWGLKPTGNAPLLPTRVINPCQEDHGRHEILIDHHEEGSV